MNGTELFVMCSRDVRCFELVMHQCVSHVMHERYLNAFKHSLLPMSSCAHLQSLQIMTLKCSMRVVKDEICALVVILQSLLSTICDWG